MSATVAPPAHAIVRALRQRGATAGLAIIVVFLLVCVLAPWIVPYDPFDQDLSSALSAPGADHWLGADQYGRDILSRLISGSRYALMAIVAAMVVQRTERGDLMFLTSTTRHAQPALDSDAPALLLAAR